MSDDLIKEERNENNYCILSLLNDFKPDNFLDSNMTSTSPSGRLWYFHYWCKGDTTVVQGATDMSLLRTPCDVSSFLLQSSDRNCERLTGVQQPCITRAGFTIFGSNALSIAVSKTRTICHAEGLWKLAWSYKQLCLPCPPDPWNLPSTALLSWFQRGALKSFE